MPIGGSIFLQTFGDWRLAIKYITFEILIIDSESPKNLICSVNITRNAKINPRRFKMFLQTPCAIVGEDANNGKTLGG